MQIVLIILKLVTGSNSAYCGFKACNYIPYVQKFIISCLQPGSIYSIFALHNKF